MNRINRNVTNISYGKKRLINFASCHSRYYVKLGIYYTSLNVVALASIPFALLRPARVENMVLCARAMRWVSRALGIRFEVKNREDRGAGFNSSSFLYVLVTGTTINIFTVVSILCLIAMMTR